MQNAYGWWDAHVQGRVRIPLDTIAEAQTYSDAVVTFGSNYDYGHFEYATCPIQLVQCSLDTLQSLLLDLDALVFGLPQCCKISYVWWALCEGVGGPDITDLMLHPFLDPFNLYDDVKAVLSDQKPALPLRPEEMLEQAKGANPRNLRIRRRLAFLYTAQAMEACGQERSKRASQALSEFETVLARQGTLDNSFFLTIAEMALEAGEIAKAKTYAGWLLQLGWQAVAMSRPSKQSGEFIHRGNILLGKAALQSGKLEAAKFHLLEAAKAPWAISSGNAQPDMTLAGQLLDKGEQIVVAKYLQLCQTIWKK